MENMIDNPHKDAHQSGFYDGLEGCENIYPEPINDWQKEYNRGHKTGKALTGR